MSDKMTTFEISDQLEESLELFRELEELKQNGEADAEEIANAQITVNLFIESLEKQKHDKLTELRSVYKTRERWLHEADAEIARLKKVKERHQKTLTDVEFLMKHLLRDQYGQSYRRGNLDIRWNPESVALKVKDSDVPDEFCEEEVKTKVIRKVIKAKLKSYLCKRQERIEAGETLEPCSFAYLTRRLKIM